MMKHPTSASTVAIPIESDECWQDPEATDAWAHGNYSPTLHPTDWTDTARTSDPIAERYEPAI